MVTGEVTGSALTLIPKQKQSDEFKLASAALMTWANCLAGLFCLALMRLSWWVMHRKCSIEQSGTVFFFFFSVCGVRSAADSDDQFCIHQDKLDSGMRPEHMGLKYSKTKPSGICYFVQTDFSRFSPHKQIAPKCFFFLFFFFGHCQDESLRDVCFLLRLKHANVCRPATLRRLLNKTK